MTGNSCGTESGPTEECARLRIVISTLEELLAVQEQVAASQSAKLQEIADFLREIYKALPVALIVVDDKGMISVVNDSAVSLLNYEEAELIGQPIGLIFKPTDTLNWAALESSPEALPTEETCISKSGLEIPVLFSARMSSSDGVRHRRVICIATDIRQQKKLEFELRQAQKLESIGQLAAGIAHEINTPTQFIGDNVRFLKEAFRDLREILTSHLRLLELAKRNTTANEFVQEILSSAKGVDLDFLMEEIPKGIEQALEGVARVATLVRAMKEFSHPGTKEKIKLDLNHAIENTITVARNEWKYVAEMETDYDSSLPKVPCLPGEFNQVILNLIVNAAQAIADVVGKGDTRKGRITVRTRDRQDYAEVRIEDTGTGIPEAVRGRVFDPFFTTKAVGRGTGQGLAIARSVIVDKLEGRIYFETELGRGTTFIVELPYRSRSLQARSAAAK